MQRIRMRGRIRRQMHSQVHRVETLLRRNAADGGGIAAISAETVALWHGVSGALTPIIGQRGMSALYERALHLAAARHPWLEDARDGSAEAPAFSGLARSMTQQTQHDAIASIATLFETFDRLLVTLIGASLTERLLQPIWAAPSVGPTRQDTSP